MILVSLSALDHQYAFQIVDYLTIQAFFIIFLSITTGIKGQRYINQQTTNKPEPLC